MKRTLSRWTEKERMPELNLTSMIDVIFLLLIFFVLTANFNEIEKFLRMNLSGSGKTVSEVSALPKPEETLHIRAAADSEGRLFWTVGEIPCADESEITAVLSAYDSLSVTAVIHPTEAAPVEQVLDLYGLCRQAGLKKIQFAASRKNSPLTGDTLPPLQ